MGFCRFVEKAEGLGFGILTEGEKIGILRVFNPKPECPKPQNQNLKPNLETRKRQKVRGFMRLQR